MKIAGWIIAIVGLSIIALVALIKYEPGQPRPSQSHRKVVTVRMPNGEVQTTLWASKAGSETIPIDTSVIPLPFAFSARSYDTNVGFYSHFDGGEEQGGKTTFTKTEALRPTNYRPPSASGVSRVFFAVEKTAYTNEIMIICTYTPVKVQKK